MKYTQKTFVNTSNFAGIYECYISGIYESCLFIA